MFSPTYCPLKLFLCSIHFELQCKGQISGQIETLFTWTGMKRTKDDRQQEKTKRIDNWEGGTIAQWLCHRLTHPADPGTNTKHTIYLHFYSQLFYYICRCVGERTNINKKRPGLALNKNNWELQIGSSTFRYNKISFQSAFETKQL